ncbi:40S ribosomal protein S22, partial [Leucoagaricus sp. SymC.cos]
NDCLNNIVNAERRGKRQVLIRPSSKVVVKFLSVMQRHGYIGEFEIIDDHRSGKIVIQLNGRLNKTGVISPRFNVQHTQIESWVNLLLPARSFGIIILTTSSGILDHEEARRKNRYYGNQMLHYDLFYLFLTYLAISWCWTDKVAKAAINLQTLTFSLRRNGQDTGKETPRHDKHSDASHPPYDQVLTFPSLL